MIAYDIQNVAKRYSGQKRWANNHINLQIKQGEFFGILGDNGSGKTTLVRQMMNLMKSTSGQITLWGQPVGINSFFVPRYVGYMPQKLYALEVLKVREALYYTAHLRGMPSKAARQECERLLTLWQIEDFAGEVIEELSGGQRRLAQLAITMAGSMPVLILDEPTNDLAPQRRRLVWDVLRYLNDEYGTTIILITHDAVEAEKVVQRVGILKEGNLVAVGRPSELKKQLAQKLRLELLFSPQYPPRLSPDLAVHEIEPGRWIVSLESTQVNEVLQQLDLSRIDDFRLFSTTLEDLYIYYVTE